MNITWLGQGGFLFAVGATRLLVDPYLSDYVEHAQNLCVNGAHEGSAVLPIPAGQVRQVPSGDSTARVIEGVDEIFDRCFAEEKLPAEIGAPWARPARPFDLTGYDTFAGPKTSAD